MHNTYSYPKFEYRQPPEVRSGQTLRCPVVVVGAGPVGLTAAIDLALRGSKVLLLDDDDTVSIGSRGVAYAKRTLEILDRLGIGDRVVNKGISWNVGRTFSQDEEVYNFKLVSDPNHKRPGMVNLQQYYLEQFLVERAEELELIDLRWKNKVVSVAELDNRVMLEVETPDGRYQVETDWLVVADGARSPIRNILGLEIEGKVFKDRFLIADVVMKADFPTERWFWFDPPFYRGQSVLLHRQADNVWRIDFQLGWQADPEEEKKPEKVVPRIWAMLGDDREFELEWVSVYTFQCRRMENFRHGRALFIGDSAHQISPFGGRGANSGMQDADNLGWKLKLVMDGLAPPSLLDSYSTERIFAADENLLNSTRSTDFITPKSKTSHTFRAAVLGLARHHAFARQLVNSGRLSVPAFLTESSLNTADEDVFSGRMVPGAPIDDGPIADGDRQGWLIDRVAGDFHVLVFADDPASIDPGMADVLAKLSLGDIPVRPLVISAKPGTAPCNIPVITDSKRIVANRFDAKDGAIYLIRPDQHVAGRWRAFVPAKIRAAVGRATCNA
jgi:3-(3-hydroxy-phenyl)propionate hydroxylase